MVTMALLDLSSAVPGYRPAEFIRIDNQCIRRSHYNIGVRVVFLIFQQAYVMQGAVLRATGSVSI